MQSIAKSLYILPTDEQERKRLEIQNEVLRTAFGGIVLAPIELQAGDNVLDSGTGSATWLLDCHNANKEVTYHGIDLKTNIYPTLDDEQKRQIHLEAGNILQLPSDWTGKFKLVNQRLLIAGFSKENWNTAVEETYRVLAPGGWVQLVEAQHCVSGEVTQKSFAMLQDLFVKKGLLLNCVEHIPNILKDTGFDQVKTQTHDVGIGGSADGDDMRAKARESTVIFCKAMQAPIVAMGIRTEVEFEKIMEDLEREWKLDDQAKAVFCVFVAQKPSTLGLSSVI